MPEKISAAKDKYVAGNTQYCKRNRKCMSEKKRIKVGEMSLDSIDLIVLLVYINQNINNNKENVLYLWFLRYTNQHLFKLTKSGI